MPKPENTTPGEAISPGNFFELVWEKAFLPEVCKSRAREKAFLPKTRKLRVKEKPFLPSPENSCKGAGVFLVRGVIFACNSFPCML